jgi:hypothetical protein
MSRILLQERDDERYAEVIGEDDITGNLIINTLIKEVLWAEVVDAETIEEDAEGEDRELVYLGIVEVPNQETNPGRIKIYVYEGHAYDDLQEADWLETSTELAIAWRVGGVLRE